MSYYFTIEKDDGKASIFPLKKTIQECREAYYKAFPDEESRQHFTEVKVFALSREYGRSGPIRSKLHGYYDKVFSLKKNKKGVGLLSNVFLNNPWSK